ncbi:MAG: hypothetical protein V7606_3664 [Burkholderiales bacterium]
MTTCLAIRSALSAAYKTARDAILIALCTAVAAVIVGCGGGVNATFVQSFDTGQTFRVYQGQALTEVRFTDAAGRMQFRKFQTPIAIEVGPPLRGPVSAQVELNPFHLRAGVVSPGIAEEGLFTILSAAVVFQGSESVHQHWRFVESGLTFSGELTLPRDSLSPTGNLIYLPPAPDGGFPVPVPFALARGTQITGAMTSDQISFRIHGDTEGRIHQLVAEVNAIRVR